MNIRRYLKSENGQTVVVIVVLMVLALTIGVTMSDRFLKGLGIVSTSDEGSKARAIAEAAVERVLLLPNQTLEEYIEFSSCGADCSLSIPDDTGQTLTAIVTLSYTGDSTDNYQLTLTEDEANEVALTGYTSGADLNVCWNGPTSIYGTYIYEDGGEILSHAYAYNSATTAHPENGFLDSSSNYGFQNCFTFSASNSPRLLRLKSYYGQVDVTIIPASGEQIPRQGILISANGYAGKSVRNVTVVKSNAYLPGVFDYVLYQKSPSDPLSN